MKYDETQREQRRDETEVGVYRVLDCRVRFCVNVKT